jgi:hypothetical protein
MKSLAPVVQTYYYQIADFDVISTQYLNDENTLSDLQSKLYNITNKVKQLALTVKDASCFSITPRRKCRLSTRKIGQSILSCISEITSQFVDLIGVREYATYECDDFNDIIANLFPSADISERIASLYNTLISTESEYNRNIHTFLLTQHHFFRSAANCCTTMSDILMNHSLCSNFVITTIPNIAQLYAIAEAAACSIQRRETLHAKNCTQELSLLTHLRQQMPLLTIDGKKIAMIPEDPSHTQFIENRLSSKLQKSEFLEGDDMISDNEGFVFAKIISSWDPFTMSRITQYIYTPIEIDPFTKLISSPEQFKGFSKPMFVYVSFNDLYQMSLSRLDASRDIIAHIRSKFVKEKVPQLKLV